MERYTIGQRAKVIQAYYENGVQIKMDIANFVIFSSFNRPNVRTIGKIVQSLSKTGSVEDVKTPVHARTARTAENMLLVRDREVKSRPPNSSSCPQLCLSCSSLMNIMHKDLHLHAYKVQLTQELKPLDHPASSMVRMVAGNGNSEWPIFEENRSSVMRHIFTSVDSSISRIDAFGRMII